MRGGAYFSANRFSELPPGQRAKIKLISGHFAINDLNKLEGFRVCAVLREPRERAVSVVRHFMRNDPRHAGLPFREVLEAVAPAQVYDFYHKRFSGIRYDAAAPSTALALEGLDRIEFLGFFDQLEPFCRRVAREVFGLDITLGWLNAAPSDFMPEPVDQARIDELTRRDLTFYSAAVAARSELSSASSWTPARQRPMSRGH